MKMTPAQRAVIEDAQRYAGSVPHSAHDARVITACVKKGWVETQPPGWATKKKPYVALMHQHTMTATKAGVKALSDNA